MPKRDSIDSESEEEASSNSDGDGSEPGDGDAGKGGSSASEYEKQRQATIAANRARMEALGLRNLASSLMAGSSQSQTSTKKQSKGKKVKLADDDDYRPEDEQRLSSSSDEDDSDDEQKNSVSKKVKNTASNLKKNTPVKKASSNSDYIDDDDALKKAIALSLKESVLPSSNKVNAKGEETTMLGEKPPEDSGKNKRKKLFTSRVQMTEDEFIVQFYQFDANWKGGISVGDLERVAIAHDFTWTDKELVDMIRCFDTDNDGKLSFDDFRKIALRCKMIKGSEDQ